jgi:hypothetical protein
MKYRILFVLLSVNFLLSGQEIELSGKVIDKNSKNELSNVIILNKDSGAIYYSDNNGNYNIKANKNEKIIFSYLGYIPQKIIVSDAHMIIELIKKEYRDLIDLQIIESIKDYQSKSLNYDENYNQDNDYFSDKDRFILNQDKIYNVYTRTLKSFDKSESEITGSPYLSDKFEIGQVFLSKLKIRIFVKMRYNIMTDQFEIIRKDSISAVKPEDVDLIIYKNKVYKIFFDRSYKQGYYELIGVFGDKMLLKKNYTELSKDPYFEGGINEKHIIRINQKEKYFVKNENSEIINEIKLKKRNAFKFFNQQKVMLDYIKSNKLKMKKEEDYIQVFNYYYKSLK